MNTGLNTLADPLGNGPVLYKVARLGNPGLREETSPFTPDEIKDPKTGEFIDSMIATMREYNGAGLAAPQVHVPKQIVIIESQNNPRDPEGENIPLTVLINPKIKSFSEETEEGWEGCLSLPDLWGRVKRSKAVTVNAVLPGGEETTIEAEGFYAVVLQHEIDHLYGKLFIDRMEDISSLSFTSEHKKYWDE